MDEADRNTLTINLEALVDRTGEADLLEVLSKLVQARILSPTMAERYKGSPKDLRDRSREFYIDIQRRGPEAFSKLVEALDGIGQWNLVKILRPGDPLNTGTNFISLREHKQSPKPMLLRMTDYASNLLNEETQELRPISVTHSKEIAETPHSDITCYSMKSKNRGIVLMINNIEFENNIEETRLGASEDEKNLRELFKQIGFHQFILHNNLTKAELESTLRDFAKDPMLRQTDCFFLIVASHGHTKQLNDTQVRCYDGAMVPTKFIVDCFNNVECVMLQNIPKVFIFQICRGETLDYGYTPQGKSSIHPEPLPETSRTQVDGRNMLNDPVRTYSDILIIHSTVPGFQSHRDKKLGSWYFISMCQVFMDHCHNTHLEDLFKLVDLYLKDIHLKRGTLQTPSLENWGFIKHCYLNPGHFVS